MSDRTPADSSFRSRAARRRIGPLLLAVAMAFGAFPLSAQETREEAFGLLSSDVSSLESWALDYLMLMNAQGMTVPTEGRMEVQGKRVRNEMSVDVMGQNMTMTAITDESGVTWTESNILGQKVIMKSDANGGGALGGMNPASNEALIDPRRVNSLIRNNETVVFLGREELEGTEVFSFEMELDPELRQEIDATGQLAQLGIQPDKLQAMIGIEDSFPRLWQLVDAAGQALVSVMYRNVEINPELSPERFEYKPAPGANVMDLSALAEGLLGSLDEGGDLGNNPQIQELLGELNLQPEQSEPEEKEAPKASKYNTKFGPGDTAPGFRGKGLRGRTIDLSDYKGRVVLLDFWSSGSEPYRKNLDALIEIYAAHRGEAFEIIGINLDSDREAVEAFLEQHPGVTWPQIFDGKGWSSAVGTLYGIEAIPHRILVGKDGVIAKTGLRGKGLPREVGQILAE